MDDPALVGSLERVGDLPRDRQRVGQRHAASFLDQLGKCRALHQLHDEGRRGSRVLEPVNVRDVRVIERGEDLRFTTESREPVWIAGDRCGQHFQRHVAIELGVARPVDLAHPSGANGAGDLVRADACAGGQRHRP